MVIVVVIIIVIVIAVVVFVTGARGKLKHRNYYSPTLNGIHSTSFVVRAKYFSWAASSREHHAKPPLLRWTHIIPNGMVCNSDQTHTVHKVFAMVCNSGQTHTAHNVFAFSPSPPLAIAPINQSIALPPAS